MRRRCGRGLYTRSTRPASTRLLPGPQRGGRSVQGRTGWPVVRTITRSTRACGPAPTAPRRAATSTARHRCSMRSTTGGESSWAAGPPACRPDSVWATSPALCMASAVPACAGAWGPATSMARWMSTAAATADAAAWCVGRRSERRARCMIRAMLAAAHGPDISALPGEWATPNSTSQPTHPANVSQSEYLNEVARRSASRSWGRPRRRGGGGRRRWHRPAPGSRCRRRAAGRSCGRRRQHGRRRG